MRSPASSRFVDVSCDLLAGGYAVRFRASGASMRPAICDGDLVTVAPSANASLVPGNVVVYRRADRLIAHRVVDVAPAGRGCAAVVTRGDALAQCDAPVASGQVVGELVSVQRGARTALPRFAQPLMQRLMTRMTRIVKSAAGLALAFLLLCLVPHSADAAVIQQVQSGTVNNTANGTQTVTISSIDTTKSFLVFQTRSSGDRPVNTTVRGRIASATTIEFERVTNEGAPLTIAIQWYVATFGSGVSVQRGSATMSATTVNVPITAVSSMSQAFVLWSMTPAGTEVDHDADDAIVGDLTSTTNLQFRTGSAANSHAVYWQVVEFTNAADINVQRGSTSLTGTALSASVTLPTPVTTGRSFLLSSFTTTGSGTDMGARLLRGQLFNPTTLVFDRSIAGSPDNLTEIAWQVVELKDGSSVQNGTTSFAAGTAAVAQPLGVQVNVTRSIPLCAVQVGGQSMGRAAYAANDVPGEASFTGALAPTQLTLTRNSTNSAADVGWSVIQF
ncbi:MAG TPA: S24/S26 family peptidase, partial [Vicinamibacterales bacterium]|nr:S24/S26 family peptidase [Vicinamibacterales bacterium]